jgi:hypothetical protein
MRAILAGALALAAAASLAAQTPDSAAAAPALAAVRATVPAQARVVPAAPGLRRADVISCPPRRPDGCRIIGGDTYVELLDTTVHGDSGTVTVGVWRQGTNPHHPVSQQTYRFTVRRVNGAWAVVGAPQMRTT